MLRRFIGDETGAFTIEFGITMPTLMLLSLGLMEFSLVGFDFQRASEASRRAVRLAVISSPVPNTANLLEGGTIVCTSSGGTVSCDGGSPSTDADAQFQILVATMQEAYPAIQEEHLRLTYESTDVGDVDDVGGIIPLVTVEIIGLEHDFIVGHVIGVDSMTFPDFKTSVLGSGRTVNAT